MPTHADARVAFVNPIAPMVICRKLLNCGELESLTVTPISQSDIGSVQASSLFLVSRLNCAITTNDGTVLSSNQNNAAQTSC